MTSIFPDTGTAGAVEIRDAAGAPINPPDVQNAYVPAPGYVSSCPLTALPSTCDARVEPKQINAIVSELLSFAECLDPDGPWDCSSYKNLCAAFNEWVLVNITGVIIIADDPPPPPIDPGKLWWESDTGHLFLWFDDGSSQQWVQINASKTATMDQISIVGAGNTISPHSVALVDCGTY